MGTVANEAMRTYGITNGKDLVEMYPIGSIYISVDTTSPAALFGGTWEQLEGRTLIGAGTVTDENNLSQTFTLGDDGGELKHKLTLSEMPSHTHDVPYLRNDTFSYHATGSSCPHIWKYGVSRESSPHGYVTSESTGTGQSHSVLQPYLVVNIWKRTS